jgi:antitoxin VapB
MDPSRTTRSARLFRNGRNQAVRIPREFELPGEEVLVSRQGDALLLRPAPPKSLLALLGTLEPLREDFGAIQDALPEDVEL